MQVMFFLRNRDYKCSCSFYGNDIINPLAPFYGIDIADVQVMFLVRLSALFILYRFSSLDEALLGLT